MEQKTLYQSKRFVVYISILVPLFILSAQMQAQGAVGISALKCEGRIDPVGIDQVSPHFEWQLQSDKRGTMQTAYRIHVASQKELLTTGNPDLWDSGQVDSNKSHYISYNGKKLQPSQKYY